MLKTIKKGPKGPFFIDEDRYLDNAFHGRHVTAKFLADYFYWVAADCVIDRDQFPIVDIIVSTNTLADNVCIDLAHEVS
jgi:hypothetical protein